MAQIGYKLSSEEQAPRDLVAQARRAEQAGFTFALISDHYHPWIDRQGQSPFVWSVIGAVAQVTARLQLATAVTCPTVRLHPAVVAQAAATTAALMPGRFALGVGAGENLNEHIVGEGWPETEIRQERLVEAIEIIRLLWRGELCSHRGRHYTVENARLYTLPATPPPLLIAVGGPLGASLAARHGDGLIGTDPEPELLSTFEANGGRDKPRYGEVTVCWAKNERQARRTAREWWPTAAMESSLSWDLPLPAHFEAVAQLVDEDAVASAITCGPEADDHVRAIEAYVKAGYDHVCVHQVGPEQDAFIDFYAREVLPRVGRMGAPARKRGRPSRRPQRRG